MEHILGVTAVENLTEIIDGFIENWKTSDDKYHRNLQRIPNDTQAFRVDFNDFYMYNPDAAISLLENPENVLTEFSSVVKAKVQSRGVFNLPQIDVEIVNLPVDEDIRKIDYRKLGKLIQIDGIILSVSVPEQRMTRSVFNCLKCGASTIVEQNTQFAQYANKCPQCNATNLTLVPEECSFKKIQAASIQERPENVPAGRLPRRFKLEFEERLVESVKPGSRVKVVGVLKARQRRKLDQQPVLTLYLKVNSVDDQSQQTGIVSITPEDIEEFKKMASQPDHLKHVTKSICPTIYGNDIVKRAMALQQCEGVRKIIGGETRRGQLHILLAGDPGLGKTVLLNFAADLNPRGIKVTGRGSTAAGLTATVTRDEAGEWILMAGAMVLADGGIVCADEGEKMRKEDREAMHPAMSSQIVPINKAGINAVLNTRASVLMACNPKGGRWDIYKTFTENINLPPSLISRFDLIFVFKSDRTVEDEMQIAQHVMKLHSKPESIRPPIEYDMLRKLFAYARTLKPTISNAAMKKLGEFYESMYRASLQAGSIMITMRQLEGLIRLTEASAKLHLREEATIEDAEIAIETLYQSLLQSGIDPATGQIDIDIYQSGIPKSLRSKLSRLVNVVRELSKSNTAGNWVGDDALKDWLVEHWKITESEAGRLLEIAEREGVIFCSGLRRDRWMVA